MDARVEKIENGEAHLQIEVSAEKFEEGMEYAYRKVVKKISVPGFRKGKVPRQIMENYYGREVLYEDALEHVIPEAYEKALGELDLKVLSQPEFDFDIESIEPGKPLNFKVKVGIEPEVVLGDIEGIEVEIPEIKVTDELVENRLNDMLARYAQVIDKGDQPSEMGDTVTIDFEGFIDAVPFEGGKGENHQLTLGSNTFVPGFEEQLVGFKTGDVTEINVTFPDDYHSDLAGKPAVFKVAIKSVQTRKQRELNDEFAQEVSECDTVEELREETRQNLEKAVQKQYEEMTRQQVLQKAAERCEIILADSSITENAKGLAQVFAQNLAQQGMGLNQYLQMTGTTMEQLLDNFKPEAESDLRNSFMLRKIIEEKGIEVTDEEINNYLITSAEETGLPVEQIKKNLEKAMDMVENQIKRDKAIEYLVDKAKVTYYDPFARQAEQVAEAIKEKNEREKQTDPESMNEEQN